MQLPPTIELNVVSRLPAEAGPTAAGFFRESDRRVFNLGYLAFEAQGNIPVTRALYRSLAAHEVAHAVAAHNFQVPKPTIEAKEYVAYVLRVFPDPGFDGEGQINTIVYLMDPMRFGVRAYRHFLAQRSGSDFLRSVMLGSTMPE